MVLDRDGLGRCYPCLALDAPSTASVLMSLQGDFLSVVSAGGIIRVLVARADTHEEDSKGRDRCCKDGAASLGRRPDSKGGTEPYFKLLVRFHAYE